MGALKDWVDQDWVRVGTDGKIKGACGTSKDKKNPDRCLPRSKAQSLSKEELASTAKKKKREGAKGKTVVSNTKKAKVRNMNNGGIVETKSKRKFNGKTIPKTAVARGCGRVMSNRRKRTKGAVSQS
jgi:glucan-binding YG repeat protein|tara:strand:+ start:219 stop:599 length:381 start_codon:yes stop_codon:yes gene_type:complete